MPAAAGATPASSVVSESTTNTPTVTTPTPSVNGKDTQSPTTITPSAVAVAATARTLPSLESAMANSSIAGLQYGSVSQQQPAAEGSAVEASTSAAAAGAGVGAGASVHPSKASNGVAEAEGANGMHRHESALLEHIYQQGFINGQFSDVLLYYRQDRPPFKGHSLILTLSPTLGALLNPNAQRQPQEIFLSLTEHPEITDEALWIVIGYLYSSRSLGMVTTANAPAVLSAALLLQNDQVADYATSVCKEAIESIVSPQAVTFWINMLESTIDGKAPAGTAQRRWDTLRDALMNRLVITLPRSLHAFTAKSPNPQQQAEAQGILQRIYSVLPFDVLKEVLESPRLGAGEGDLMTDQARFGLAKQIIATRKKMAASIESRSGAQDAEESVVLAFGGAGGASGGTNVSIVKKPKQSRKLWKVGG